MLLFDSLQRRRTEFALSTAARAEDEPRAEVRGETPTAKTKAGESMGFDEWWGIVQTLTVSDEVTTTASGELLGIPGLRREGSGLDVQHVNPMHRPAGPSPPPPPPSPPPLSDAASPLPKITPLVDRLKAIQEHVRP